MLPRPAPRKVWQQGQDKWHIDAPVAVAGDLVLAASAYLDDEKIGDRTLYGLDARDGSVRWKQGLRLNPWAGPTVAGDLVLVGCSSVRFDPKVLDGARGEVVAVDRKSGQVKWNKEIPGGVVSSVAVKDGLAIFTATDGKVRALDAATGQERWTHDAGAPFFAAAAVAGGSVYVADLKGVVHALNLKDGKGQWRFDLGKEAAVNAPGMVYGSPVVHRGRIYLATCNLEGEKARQPTVILCLGDK
jgi:outer membrane protein assembly factor BamB